MLLHMATGLDSARFRSVPVVGGEGLLAEQLREHALSPYIVPSKGSFNVRYLNQLVQLARRRQIDVIVAHLYGAAVYASLAGALLSIPVVSVLHGHTDVSTSERMAAVKAAVLRHGSRKVVFVSQQLQENLRPRLRLSAAQCTVIPNGVDTNAFQRSVDRSLRAELGLTDDVILIGAIGNVRGPKAYDVLLRAARVVLDQMPQAQFVIAGDCANALGEELKTLSRGLGMERRVTFLGLRSDVARILNNLDAFVLSSQTEGFSIACIEAMACGVPVVATRSGGPEEILENEAGILVPTGDPESLAAALIRVIGSRDLAMELTARATARVQERYSLRRMLSRYEQVLAEVVDESRR